MPKLLDGAVGEHMDLPAYFADFPGHYARTREFWKLERGQSYAEPGEESWEAFDRGDWEQSLRLIEQQRQWLTGYFQDSTARGMSSRRIRIVSLPPSEYLQWELHLLRLRDELGESIRVLLARDVADMEAAGELPDISTMDADVMYQPVYDDHGVMECAVKYTDKALVRRCRDLIASLYERGEPISHFFQREVAPLPPARPTVRAIPPGYMDQLGRLPLPRS
jgi:hypothetical protein